MMYICMIQKKTQRKLLIPSPLQWTCLLLPPSSPGHWHDTYRCERMTLTYGLTLSRQATAQTRASTCPYLKRRAVATWSKWEAKSKPGRNAGSCLIATDARSPTMQVGQKKGINWQMHMYIYRQLYLEVPSCPLQISMKPSWKESFTSKRLKKCIMIT